MNRRCIFLLWVSNLAVLLSLHVPNPTTMLFGVLMLVSALMVFRD